MNKTIATVETLTYAMKAKKLLSGSGIRSKLVKLDRSSKNKGCSYGLEFASKYYLDVIEILRGNNFEFGIL